MSASASQHRLGTIRLLVSEDNQHSMKLLTSVLRAFGFRDIYEATNGADALEIFWTKKIDLVITDHFMPLYTGAELARHIRTGPKSPNPLCPIIAVTPGTTRPIVEELRDAGINEVVAKPFTPRDLLAKVSAVIERPRAFVRGVAYFGPDRRRRIETLDGPERRVAAPALV